MLPQSQLRDLQLVLRASLLSNRSFLRACAPLPMEVGLSGALPIIFCIGKVLMRYHLQREPLLKVQEYGSQRNHRADIKSVSYCQGSAIMPRLSLEEICRRKSTPPVRDIF